MTRIEFYKIKQEAAELQENLFDAGSLRGYLLDPPLTAIHEDESKGIHLQGSEKEQEDWRIEAARHIDEAVGFVRESMR